MRILVRLCEDREGPLAEAKRNLREREESDLTEQKSAGVREEKWTPCQVGGVTQDIDEGREERERERDTLLEGAFNTECSPDEEWRFDHVALKYFILIRTENFKLYTMSLNTLLKFVSVFQCRRREHQILR